MKFNKLFTVGLSLALICTQVSAKTRFISPNNDGVQDELTIPLSISDKRFIQGWSLVITDSNREVVRVIENKVALPEKIGFKSFFKQLITPKQGVSVPEYVIWNGAMENGETAPDGTYYYYITATDDNGNVGKTKEYQVIVDTLAPEIELANIPDKIFGEGAKASLKIKQSGSVEDEWVAVFKNIEGEVVKTYKWTKAEPADFNWYGTDDEGARVRDGVYSYEIKATDKAGNVSPQATITNIIYSSEKPATNIYVNGSRYFSPQTDSTMQNIMFSITIPVPDSKSGNSLVEWNVDIEDKSSGVVVKSYNNVNTGSVPPSSIIFDGTDNNGNLLADGKYQASVTAKYSNGSVPDKIYSAEVVLDTQKPEVRVAASDKVFGAGTKDSVKFTITRALDSGAEVSSWKAQIKTKDGATVVRSYDFNEIEFGETYDKPVILTWNGITDNGGIAEKGEYQLVLTATDAAGNIGGGSSKDLVMFDKTEAQLVLAMTDTAFSPNGDNVKDSIKFNPVTETKAINSYVFDIKDSTGNTVYSANGFSILPSSFEWDGKGSDKILCADGKYTATLAVEAANGSKVNATTQEFELDTVYPKLVAEAAYSAFSPDGDGNQDAIEINIKESTNEKLWTADVRDSKDKSVKKYTWSGSKTLLSWNGTDEAGNICPDGKYNVVIFSTDAAGNNFATELKGFTLDNRETKAYVTAEYEGISPNNDGVLDVQKFGIQVTVNDSIRNWNFNVIKEDGTSVFSVSDKATPNLPSSITWNGADANGNACEGTFTGVLSIDYLKGNKVNVVSSPFVCTATAPVLKVQTAVASGQKGYFSPDNDGVDDDLYIKLTGSTKANIKNWSFTIKDPKGKTFWTTNGKSQIKERIIWDGLSNVQKNANGKAERVQSASNYPYEFTATDTLGMTSTVTGEISIDVLVIRDGNVLKMAVPSIIFESDSANFQKANAKLTQEQIDKNIKTLDRIAEILKKFKDYKVTIEGHANKITDDPNEEIVDNPNKWGRASTPLSGERAEAIKAYLVKKGVSASSLSTNGLGGTKPVVNPKDKDNNWKNRRVEFILVK